MGLSEKVRQSQLMNAPTKNSDSEILAYEAEQEENLKSLNLSLSKQISSKVKNLTAMLNDLDVVRK